MNSPPQRGAEYRRQYEVTLSCGHKNTFCDPQPPVGDLYNCGYHGDFFEVLTSVRVFKYEKREKNVV